MSRSSKVQPPRFSRRTGPASPNPIALAEAGAAAGGRPLERLNDSNPTRFGLAPDFLPQEYRAEPRGPIGARRALADHLRDLGDEGAVDPERTYLLSSTSQAYSWLFKLLCDAGQAILEPRPGYPLVESIARLECVDALQYRLAYDGSWTIDLASVRSLLEQEGGRIKALVVINPNNPTGSYLHPEEREALVGLCQEYGLALIADEVFFGYPLEPLPGRRRLAGEDRVLTFALDGFSKMLAAPHAKVGWIRVSGPRDQVGQALSRLDVIADDYLPMSQILADRMPSMLAQAARQTARVRGRVTGNLALLKELLNPATSCISVLRAEGGWNALLRFPSVIDENALVLRLIDGYGVTGQPGYFFDMPSNGYMALSLLPEEGRFRRGVECLSHAVDDLLH